MNRLALLPVVAVLALAAPAAADAPTLDERVATLEAQVADLSGRLVGVETDLADAQDNVTEALRITRCVKVAEGSAIRRVNGRRVFVDVPDAKAEVWVALLAPSCVTITRPARRPRIPTIPAARP